MRKTMIMASLIGMLGVLLLAGCTAMSQDTTASTYKKGDKVKLSQCGPDCSCAKCSAKKASKCSSKKSSQCPSTKGANLHADGSVCSGPDCAQCAAAKAGSHKDGMWIQPIEG